MLNIVVCMKAVPDPKQACNIKIDPRTKTLLRCDVPLVVNPLDRHALESALQIKAQQETHISVLSMGPPEAGAIVKECLALGADTGVLLCDSGEGAVAIAGLVRQELADGSSGIELLRDVAWDGRLRQALPALLHQLLTQRPGVALVTDQADSALTQLLSTGGWQPVREELLLGRSLWRQHGRTRAVPLTHSRDTMLGRLQPQHPPLPTPSLGRR